MLKCPRCGTTSPQTKHFCRICGFAFDQWKRKKQRSFFVGLLWLLGIRYNPQNGSWGCAFVPATITVATITTLAAAIIVGPVLQLYPPFSNPAIVIQGNVIPGQPVAVHGKHFPPKHPIDLLLDGVRVAAVASHYDPPSQIRLSASITAGLTGLLHQTGQISPAKEIIVQDDGTFDARIIIPANWQPSSQHIIEAQAAGSNGRAMTSAQYALTLPSTASASQSHVPPSLNYPTGNFTVKVVIKQPNSQSGETFLLEVRNGIVCQQRDTGQTSSSPFVYPGSGSDASFTRVFSCKGTYQNGHLSYTETAERAEYDLEGDRAGAKGAYIYIHLEGDFSNTKTIAGQYTFDLPTWSPVTPSSVALADTLNHAQEQISNKNGTWTGEVV